MGEKIYYQPLTREDRITVILYRTGIFLSSLILCLSAYLAARGLSTSPPDVEFFASGFGVSVLLLALYFSVGLSVFFIHLYIGRFHRILKNIYYAAFACLVALFVLGNGNPGMAIIGTPHYSTLLLIPLSLCLGFVTAKEAFCFQLIEGYLIAMVMPLYIFLFAMGALNARSAAYGMIVIAAMLFFFMIRKVFMPIAFDIGDKSAYQP